MSVSQQIAAKASHMPQEKTQKTVKLQSQVVECWEILGLRLLVQL